MSILLDACVLYLLLGREYFTFSDTVVNVLTGEIGGSSNWMNFLAAGGSGLLGIAGLVISFFTGSSVDFAGLSESLSGGGLTLLQTGQLMEGLQDAAGLIRNQDFYFYTEVIRWVLLGMLAFFLILEVLNLLLAFFGKGVNLFCAVYGTVFFLVLTGAAAAIDYAVGSEQAISAIFGQLPVRISVWALCCLVLPYLSRALMKNYAKGKRKGNR